MMASIALCLVGFVVLVLGVVTFYNVHHNPILGRKDRQIGYLMAGWLVMCGAVLMIKPAVAQVPQTALKYRATLTRTAQMEMGLDAPVATFAAQITQESAWNPQAESAAGAKGLAQFMPATARWMGDIDKRLAGAKVYNPGWAMRAMIVYDHWLLVRVQAVDTCNRWAMTLAAYNGGLGWVYRDQRLAESKGLSKRVWFDSVARVNAGRATVNFQENRAYPKRILQHWEPQFVQARWGQGVCEQHQWGAHD